MATPMVLHIYDEDSEVKRTVTRSFVPWKLLKESVKLSKNLDIENMTDENVDELTGLVVAVFGDQVTVEELNEGSDIDEMVTVLNQILARARGKSTNPTPPG